MYNKTKYRKLPQINSLWKLIYYSQDNELMKDMVASPLSWHFAIQSECPAEKIHLSATQLQQ